MCIRCYLIVVIIYSGLLDNIISVLLQAGRRPAAVTPAVWNRNILSQSAAVVIAHNHMDCNVQITLAGGANCPVAFPYCILQRGIFRYLAVSLMCLIVSVKSSQVQVSIQR